MIFTLWEKVKHKKFKVTTILDLLLIALFVLVALFVREVRAYELPEQFRKWNEESIDVWYNSEGCLIETQGLWHRAARKWDVVGVVEKGEHEFVGYDQRPTLYCAESDPAAIVFLPPGVSLTVYYLRSAVGNLVIGSAHSYWIGTSLVDVDIRLHPYWVNDQNVEEVMLHEFGHGIGIDHSHNPESIMYYLVRDGAYLHADDLLASCELYQQCPQWDNQMNLVIQTFQYKGGEKGFKDKCYYGYLIAGGIWPSDVHATETECK